MTTPEALKIQKEIENILNKNKVYYKSEYVKSPDIKFINIVISIKVTKE